MSPQPTYSFALTEAELRRYQAMADVARTHEAGLWAAAGIGPGATVVDLGCGPGTFLPTLAAAVGPEGRVIGVDRSDDAIARAREAVTRSGLGDVVALRCRPCDDTGLAEHSVDTVFMRNVLVHNGPVIASVLAHVASVLRGGGHALLAEPDLTALVLPDDAPDEQELEERWREWMVGAGNDPGLGGRLPDTIAAHGFEVLDVVRHVDTFTIERSPALTAGDHLIRAGLATSHDVERWHAAAERRLATTGPMQVSIPTTAVVAAR